MANDMHKRHLDEANRHVAVGRALVARQHDLIDRLAKDGIDTRDARSLLGLIEETLGLMLVCRDEAQRACERRHSC
jgi:hypothetical protein